MCFFFLWSQYFSLMLALICVAVVPSFEIAHSNTISCLIRCDSVFQVCVCMVFFFFFFDLFYVLFLPRASFFFSVVNNHHFHYRFVCCLFSQCARYERVLFIWWIFNSVRASFNGFNFIIAQYDRHIHTYWNACAIRPNDRWAEQQLQFFDHPEHCRILSTFQYYLEDMSWL